MRCDGCGLVSQKNRRFSLTNGALRLCEVCIADLNRQNPELSLHRAKAENEYWAWRGDDNDHLESLTCPVLISAADLREIIGRDGIEKQRVIEAIGQWIAGAPKGVKLVDWIYPPKVKKLPAGWYAVRVLFPGISIRDYLMTALSDFVPEGFHEYRPIKNPFETA